MSKRSSTEAAPAVLGGIDFGSSIRRKSLALSCWDGLLATAMICLVETFSVAAALHLHAPSFAIAMLGSLPLFLSSFGQLIVPSIVDHEKGRKFYVVYGAFAQSVFLIICALSGKLPYPWGTTLFVFSLVGYGIGGSSFIGLWMTWMRELVPPSVRGRHFAWRNRLFSAGNLACQLVTGLLAHAYTADTAPWAFYVTVFLIASVFRLGSAVLLTQQWEPSIPFERAKIFDFHIPKRFLIYALSIGLLQGAAAMAGPFFSVWFLRDLKFNFFELSLLNGATVLGSILFIKAWGKLADKVGNFQVLHLSALMLSVVPLPYLFFNHPLAICLLNFYSGICWCGFNLGNFNYLLESAGREKPERFIAIASAASGMMVFIFGLIGGLLANHLPVLFGWKLRSLFLLSSFFRLFIVAACFRFIESTRRTDGISPLDLFAEFPVYRNGLDALRTTFRAFRKI